MSEKCLRPRLETYFDTKKTWIKIWVSKRHITEIRRTRSAKYTFVFVSLFISIGLCRNSGALLNDLIEHDLGIKLNMGHCREQSMQFFYLEN